MLPSFARVPTAIFLAACLSSGTAAAEVASYRVEFGGRVLGTVTFSDGAKGGGQSLRTTLDNTPFGLFDGTFEADSRLEGESAGETRRLYASKSRSTRKARDISFVIDAGRAEETVVSPASEETSLSVPDAVPASVIDPVAAFGRIVRAKGCPEGFTFYDGRRVDEIVPSGADVSGGMTRCKITFTVIAGPGHLSPFRFTEFSMMALYDAGEGSGKGLREIDVRAGLLGIRLIAAD
ncbi:DUF3108 domain-containing protein [Defluviimonas sp. SAOS-178_SWC]|uniref:DUF3108 domain-containing protein n=1 Tax=Defluviimonas sp. SAOS-178_SWC TaxID=3121287 RepID=UPI003222218A